MAENTSHQPNAETSLEDDVLKCLLLINRVANLLSCGQLMCLAEVRLDLLERSICYGDVLCLRSYG